MNNNNIAENIVEKIVIKFKSAYIYKVYYFYYFSNIIPRIYALFCLFFIFKSNYTKKYKYN